LEGSGRITKNIAAKTVVPEKIICGSGFQRVLITGADKEPILAILTQTVKSVLLTLGGNIRTVYT